MRGVGKLGRFLLISSMDELVINKGWQDSSR
jgi:hypothetical protein